MSLRLFRLLTSPSFFSVNCRPQLSCSKWLFHSVTHLSQTLTENKYLSEIAFAHRVLELNPNYSEVVFPPFSGDKNKSNFIDLVRCVNWLNLTTNELVEKFNNVSQSADVPINDLDCVGIRKVLVDRCQEMTDEQLATVLKSLALWPMCESPNEECFKELWLALDNVCIARWKKWEPKKIFLFLDLWYHLYLTRQSTFVFKASTKLALSPSRLSKEEVVLVLFYLSLLRTTTKSISMFEIEYKLTEVAPELSLDEIAVSVMGFFKADKSLYNEKLMSHLMDRLIQEASTVSDITFTAIIKELRRSLPINLWGRSGELGDSISQQVARFSLPAAVHGLLFTTRAQFRHPPLLSSVAQKLVDNIAQARIKDMEKTVFSLTQLDFDPRTVPCVFTTILAELEEARRVQEISAYPKSFIALIHYFCIRGIFPLKWMKKILEPDFITLSYGPKKYNYGRELLFIDCCIEVECPDYEGPRLPSDVRHYLSKRYSEYLPDPERKMSRHQKLFHDVIQTAEVLFGKENMCVKYLLPHFPKADIVVRLDEKKVPLGVSEELRGAPPFGDCLRAPDTSYFALVNANVNMFLHGGEALNGETCAKLRQLNRIGYTPIVISHNSWPSNGTLEKVQYLQNLIESGNS